MDNGHRFLPLLILAAALAGLFTACGRDQSHPTLAEVGRPAPDFTLSDTAGNPWALSDLRGKVVLVNFWATWCPPCRQELPSMEILRRQLAGRPFQMLTILVNDDPRLAVNLARRSGTTFPILVDQGNTAGSAYGITGVPETFIIDPSGVLREKIIGPRHWTSPASREMILQYLPGVNE